MILLGSLSLLAEGRLRGLDQALERRRLGDREVGDDLAIQLDAGQLQAVDELGIAQAMLAGAGIDALDPEGAEAALLVAPVAIGILQPLLDLLDRNPVAGMRATAIALGEVKDLLVAGVG